MVSWPGRTNMTVVQASAHAVHAATRCRRSNRPASSGPVSRAASLIVEAVAGTAHRLDRRGRLQLRAQSAHAHVDHVAAGVEAQVPDVCLLYTSDAADDLLCVDL